MVYRKIVTLQEECSPTLRAGTVPAAVALENHPTDSRVKISEDGKVQTLTSRMGTGGMNVPLLLKIRSGCEGGGKGPLIQEDKSATLSCNNDQTLFEPKSLDFRNIAVNEELSATLQEKSNGGHSLNYINPVAYGICAKDSNSMKSSNPKSGFYKADTTRCLDVNGGNPSCNQGGMAVVALEGNGSRPSHRGNGCSEENVSYTILGKPYFTSQFAPTIEAGAKVMAFGDFSFYWIGDRQGISFKRLNELYAGNGQVGFLASKRLDGKLVLPEAVKVLQMKAGSST